MIMEYWISCLKYTLTTGKNKKKLKLKEYIRQKEGQKRKNIDVQSGAFNNKNNNNNNSASTTITTTTV